jgi:hypothetical protein
VCHIWRKKQQRESIGLRVRERKMENKTDKDKDKELDKKRE